MTQNLSKNVENLKKKVISKEFWNLYKNNHKNMI